MGSTHSSRVAKQRTRKMSKVPLNSSAHLTRESTKGRTG